MRIYEMGKISTAHGRTLFVPMAKIFVARRLLVIKQTVKSTASNTKVAEKWAFAFIFAVFIVVPVTLDSAGRTTGPAPNLAAKIAKVLKKMLLLPAEAQRG